MELIEIQSADDVSRAAILTPKHCRTKYPHDEAVRFLQGIGGVAVVNRPLILAERKRFAGLVAARKANVLSDTDLPTDKCGHWTARELRMLIDIRA